MTDEEIQMIRNFNNQRQREWWSRMTADERRERRQRYALTQAKRKAAQAKKAGKGKRA